MYERTSLVHFGNIYRQSVAGFFDVDVSDFLGSRYLENLNWPSFIASRGAAELRAVCPQAHSISIGKGRAAEVLREHAQPGPEKPVVYIDSQYSEVHREVWHTEAPRTELTEEEYYQLNTRTTVSFRYC